MRREGLYLTWQRRKIVRVLVNLGRSVSVEELSAERALRSISPISVYRLLRELDARKILRRSFGHGGRLHFQLLPDERADCLAVTCRCCGRVETIPFEPITQVQAELQTRGYRSLSHVADFTGICSQCIPVPAPRAPVGPNGEEPKPVFASDLTWTLPRQSGAEFAAQRL